MLKYIPIVISVICLLVWFIVLIQWIVIAILNRRLAKRGVGKIRLPWIHWYLKRLGFIPAPDKWDTAEDIRYQTNLKTHYLRFYCSTRRRTNEELTIGNNEDVIYLSYRPFGILIIATAFRLANRFTRQYMAD